MMLNTLPGLITAMENAATDQPDMTAPGAMEAHVSYLQDAYRKFFAAQYGIAENDPDMFKRLMEDVVRVSYMGMVMSTAVAVLAIERKHMMHIAKAGHNGDSLSKGHADFARKFSDLISFYASHLNTRVPEISYDAE